MRYLRWLLLLIPVAILVELLHGSEVLLFVTSALAVIPLAGLMGEATEALAEKTGPRLGGLLNATLGNAAELIITLFAVRAGLLDLVKASLIGSILGNVLLVMGFSILARRAEERHPEIRSIPRGRRCHHDHSGRHRPERSLILQRRHRAGHAARGRVEPDHGSAR